MLPRLVVIAKKPLLLLARRLPYVQTWVGAALLISIIPAFIGFSITYEEVPVLDDIFAFTVLIALIAGPVFLIMGKRESSIKDALHYAECNDWHPITKTSWRSIKGDNVSLAVKKSQVGKSFILSIESDQVNHTVEEFERLAWAMQFGDWLWNYLVQKNVKVNTTEIALARSELTRPGNS